MKNFYNTILILLITNLCFSQTYIPMPAGYGLFDGVNVSCIPFCELNGFLYVYSKTNSTTTQNHGNIFKVNATTNIVTMLTGDLGEGISNVQINNGIIYFLVNTEIYRINNANNSVEYLTNCQGNYLIVQDYIYLNGSISYVYNLISGVSSPILENITNLNVSLDDFYLYDNQIYCYGHQVPTSGGDSIIYLVSGTNASPVFSLNDGISQFLTFSNLFKPIRVNNNLLFLSQNGTNFKLTSLNLNNNLTNSNYFTFQDNSYGNNMVKPIVLNNQVFITDGNQLYVSDGNSTPVLTNIPTFNKTYFGRSNHTPFIGGSNPEDYIYFNNKIYGKRASNIPGTYDLWVTDCTQSGTYNLNLYSDENATGEYNSAMLLNNKMYYRRNYNVNSIFSFDGINTQLVYNNNGSFGSISDIYGSGNFLFWTMDNVLGTGLFKFDLSTLSTHNLEEKLKISLSPNPTNQFVNITTNEKLKSIKIIDITGKESNIDNYENNKIDVSNLQNGIYILVFKTENGIIKEKFIKK